jgi:hypothetical protein
MRPDGSICRLRLHGLDGPNGDASPRRRRPSNSDVSAGTAVAGSRGHELLLFLLRFATPPKFSCELHAHR